MGDPLSVAASVAGLLSLGIEVSQSLVAFYTSFKDQDAEIARTTRKLEDLLGIFQSLEEALRDRTFQSDERSLIVKIESLIQSCDDLLHELQEECQKFSKSSTNGVRAAVKSAGRRLIYPFRKSTLQKLDEDASEIRENLSLALNVLQLNGSSTIQNEIVEIKSLISLLKAPDATVNYNEACAKRHPNSGLWLVKSPVFSTWLEDNNSFLWLNGFAGCGKTVLSSTVIQYAFRHRRSDPRVGIVFFYFSFNDESKQDVSGMLRAMLLQLSNQLKDGHVDLVRLHNNYSSGVAPVPTLMETFRHLIQRFHDVYIIVDALDESPKYKTRERVLDAIADLRNWSLRGLHVLVTSRDEPDIREHLDPSPVEDISMKNAGIDKDIAEFVSEHLVQSRALRKWLAYHSQIKTALIARAGGVFRGVECQFQSLASCPRSEDFLQRLLASLPRSLDESYERMLLRIDDDSIEYAKRILTWLCFAKRPLTVRELIDGVAVELGGNPRLNLKRRLQDEDDIRRICPGFIDINLDPDYPGETDIRHKTSHTVQIAHYSVQEYLESDRICRQKAKIFSMRSTASNSELTQLCLVYLMDPAFENLILPVTTFDEFPLAQYAAQYWHEHHKNAQEMASQVNQFTVQLFESENVFLNWIRLYDPDVRYGIQTDFNKTSNDVASPLYYTSLLGLNTVLQELLGARRDGRAQIRGPQELSSSNISSLLNTKGGKRGTALQAASEGGHEAVVRLLLEQGAEVNAPAGGVDFDGTALQAASRGGHEVVVRLLLEQGADVDAPAGGGAYYGTALQAASRGRHETVVRLLEAHISDVR